METYDPWKIRNNFEWVTKLVCLHRKIEDKFYKDYKHDFLAIGVWDFEEQASKKELLEYFVFEIDYGNGDFDHFDSDYLTQDEFFAKALQYFRNQFRYSSEDISDKCVEDLANVIFSVSTEKKLFCIFEINGEETWRLGVVEDKIGRHIVAFARYEN